MQIVTDSATDVSLSAEQMADLNIHVVPLVVTLDGKTYYEGVDITPDRFYSLLEATNNLPTTSQPSAGDFAGMYRRLAQTDRDILSIHITSNMSGTYNSAVLGAEMTPEANITVIDTKTLTAAAGWQVEAAARAVKAGWSLDKTLALMKQIGDAAESIYTLNELKYLIHGGRISHIKGVMASLLNIKPLIGVEKSRGTFEQMGQARTFNKAVKELVVLMQKQHAPGSHLRVQVLYSYNPEGAAMLREEVEKVFTCHWLPMGPMSLVLGAHTGKSMVGVAYAAESVFAAVP